MAQPETITRADYDGAMEILTQLHRWQLTPDAIARAFSSVSKVSPGAFAKVYEGAMSRDGYYKPADFLGELKATHREAAATPPRLPPAKHSPDVAMWVRLRKQLAYIKANKNLGAAGWDLHWSQLLRSPVTEADIAALGATSLADILSGVAGGTPAPDKYER